jgi:hypothetical protein
MPQKTKQPGDMGELPKLKITPTGTLNVFADSKRDIYAGLGPQKDIVALDVHPLKSMHGDVGAVLVREGQRVIAISSYENGHAYCARLISTYLTEATDLKGLSVREIEGGGVRLNVRFEGQERNFFLDNAPETPGAKDAVSLLVDLGVKREDIIADRTRFKQA